MYVCRYACPVWVIAYIGPLETGLLKRPPFGLCAAGSVTVRPGSFNTTPHAAKDASGMRSGLGLSDFRFFW